MARNEGDAPDRARRVCRPDEPNRHHLGRRDGHDVGDEYQTMCRPDDAFKPARHSMVTTRSVPILVLRRTAAATDMAVALAK